VKARVLIVDDEPSVRLSLERALKRRGYEVVAVDSADAAYECLSEESVDAVLLDVRLPHVRGEAFFFALIRRWPGLASRTVLMSGHPYHLEEGWPEALRGCQFLLKPFPLGALYRAVERCLDHAVTDRQRNAINE